MQQRARVFVFLILYMNVGNRYMYNFKISLVRQKKQHEHILMMKYFKQFCFVLT